MDSLPLGQIDADLEITDQEGGLLDLEDQDETLSARFQTKIQKTNFVMTAHERGVFLNELE
jgi:hypothetical protein